MVFGRVLLLLLGASFLALLRLFLVLFISLNGCIELQKNSFVFWASKRLLLGLELSDALLDAADLLLDSFNLLKDGSVVNWPFRHLLLLHWRRDRLLLLLHR